MCAKVRMIAIALLGLGLTGCAASQRTESMPATAQDDLSPSQPKPTHLAASEATDAAPAPADRYEITLAEIGEHVRNQSAVIVDARSPEHFAEGHVPGAINVPAGQMEAYLPTLWEHAAPDDLVIIYCGGQWCGSGDMVFEFLSTQGFTNLRVYKPGWMVLASAKM